MNATKRNKTLKHWFAGALLTVATACTLPAFAQPLKVGYSDWPGWVAWQVAIDKGWFKEAGVDVKFEWFDYSASMEAFAAGKLDAVNMTNGDALVTGSGGGKSVMIMLNDYSNGNDMIIGKPGIKSLKDLKGKKVAIELGFVEHLLLLNGLKKAGMKASDVVLVNAKTNEMTQMLGAADIAAIGAWQPTAGQAIAAMPGAKPIYTSADEPGLIYDALAVNPASLKANRAEWMKVVKVWDRVAKYINDPTTQPDALKIMSARVGLTPEAYLPMLKGTKLLTISEGKKFYTKAAGFKSLYGSTKIADEFNVANAVYKAPENVDSYIDASFMDAK